MSKSKSNSETVPWDETETPSAAVTEEPIGFSEFDSFGSSDGADDPEDAPIPPEKEPLIDEIPYASEEAGLGKDLTLVVYNEKNVIIIFVQGLTDRAAGDLINLLRRQSRWADTAAYH